MRQVMRSAGPLTIVSAQRLDSTRLAVEFSDGTVAVLTAQAIADWASEWLDISEDDLSD
jgi:hypothetical protein